jgi:hypothetical protein
MSSEFSFCDLEIAFLLVQILYYYNKNDKPKMPHVRRGKNETSNTQPYGLVQTL